MTAPTPEELRALAAEVYDDHYEDDDPDTSGPHWREACGTHTRAMHGALLAAADEIERLRAELAEACELLGKASSSWEPDQCWHADDWAYHATAVSWEQRRDALLARVRGR